MSQTKPGEFRTLIRGIRELNRLKAIEDAARKLTNTKPGKWKVQVDGELFNLLDALLQSPAGEKGE